MVIRDGVLLYAEPGALPEASPEQLIARARELDMDEVRAAIAERAASAGAPGHDTARAGRRPEFVMDRRAWPAPGGARLPV